MAKISALLLCVAVFGLFVSASVLTDDDFNSSAYFSLTRQQKLTKLMNKIFSNSKSSNFPSPLKLGGIFLESVKVSVDYVSDSVPQGRTKYVHSVGSSYSCKFTPTPDSPYTGFFQGADSIVSRFSLAKEPSYENPSASGAYDNFTPGVAFKFLIDGMPSANIFSMYGVNGVYSYNLFDQDYNSHIPSAEGVALNLIAEKFSSGSEIVQNLGLRRAAEQTQDGKRVAKPVYPFMVTFKARTNVKAMFTSDYTEDYKVTLRKIPAGTQLFDVYATESPTQTCQKLIGTITTTSVITTSLFGDESLFFQHPDYHYDLQMHQEWADYTPVWHTFGSKDAKKPVSRCPFAK